jgi:hypothetical protein
VFLFFSVARFAPNGQAQRANTDHSEGMNGQAYGENEKLPTDKLLDISAEALRMSSPFNAGYWLSAA